MKKLFLFFALVLTAGMNAWAGDYVATDYLNNDSRTRITRSPSYDDPNFTIYMFLKDTENGGGVSWDDTEVEPGHQGPAIYIDGEYFASPLYEMNWLSQNPDNAVYSWWDDADNHAQTYTKKINGVNWVHRYYDVQKPDASCYFVSMYFCPEELKGGSCHSITIKGYLADNANLTVNRQYVERTFIFKAQRLFPSNPTVTMDKSTRQVTISGSLASGEEHPTHFGMSMDGKAGDKFIPNSELENSKDLEYSTSFSGITYTMPENTEDVNYEDAVILGEMYRDFTKLGSKVTCHYYDWFNAAPNTIHYEKTEPTYTTFGYSQECWEDLATGKYYSDVAFTQELNPAQVITYAKFKSNPVTAQDIAFTLKDATYEGVQFNWAAETTYPYGTTGTRSVEFTVFGTDVANARVKWTKNYNAANYGSFIITVYVNGTPVYSITQGNNALGGLSAIPLPDLKSGDKVKFEVKKSKEASWWDAKPTITACLEYTSSNGGRNPEITITADDNWKNKGDDDPELTWKITKGELMEGDKLTGISISRDAGEERGYYPIHVSQEEGTNPNYVITFVDGTFKIIDAIHHEAVEPKYETVGNVECWEDRTTGKYYSDAACTKELNPAQVLTYAKFIANPVTAYDGDFTFKDETYEGVQFNWAAETTYTTYVTGTRSVEFTVYGTDVANARVKWTKNYNAAGYGSFIITVYVNGTQVYSINQGDNALGGLSAIPLPDLKSGDKVKFEVNKPKLASWPDSNPTITACLEYTSSNGGAGVILTADDKLKNKGDDDPKLTWQITGGSLAEGDELTGIKIWREKGEEIGSYTIHVSQEEGANPKYYIAFVEGTFRISDIIHHDVTVPMYETVGFLQECWEDRTLGKYYSDAEYTQELNPALVLSYAKLITNPVTANSGFTFKDATYDGVQFNWAAETTYKTTSPVEENSETGTRSVEFTVYGTDVANARVKWTKNYNAAGYGSFIITVYVNGTQVYFINQGDNALGGLSAIPLPDLKSGDKVKFEVQKPKNSKWTGNVTIAACLEYTSSNGGEGMLITANQDPDHTENYYSTFWSSTAAYQVPEGVTAYTGKVEDSTSEPNTSVLKLTAIEDGIIPASQGVILRMTTEDNSATKQQIALAKTTATGTWSGTNALMGTDEATTLGANDYALSYGQNGVGFYLWNGKSIDAHKAYLTLPSGAKAFTFEFEDVPTGISSTEQPYNRTTETYNLNGIRVNDNYKGIVIKNGKKYLKK